VTASDDGVLDVTLTNCAVRNNRFGSVRVIADETSTVNLAISDSLIFKNRVPSVAFFGAGGIDLNANDTSIVTATVTGSVIERVGPRFVAGINAFGGDIGSSTSSLSVSVTDTQLLRNGGAGMTAYWATNLSLTNVSIIKNRGMGLLNTGAAMSLTNSVVAKNHAQPPGGGSGGIESSGTTDIVNSTIRENRGRCDFDLCGGGMTIGSAVVNLVNTIVWGNRSNGDGGDDLVVLGSSVSADHSDLGDVTGSVTDLGGNISADPLFLSATDHHLTASSPAIDAGTCAGAPGTDFEGDPRPTGTGCDMGADEFVP
jgi:hypothetical protein